MGLIFFLFLAGGIGPRARHIMAVVAPRADVYECGGAYFVFRGRDECMVVEWGVFFVWG